MDAKMALKQSLLATSQQLIINAQDFFLRIDHHVKILFQS